MNRRLVSALLCSLAIACSWTTHTPPPVDTDDPQAKLVPATPAAQLLGTWELAPAPDEAMRLLALDEILGGGPIMQANWSAADKAWLTWAAEVATRPAKDPDLVALQAFSKDLATRRMVVTDGSLTLTSPDGTWTRGWSVLNTQTDRDGLQSMVVETRDQHDSERVAVRFEDADHFLFGPGADPARMVRWGRVRIAP